jgi:hypothetical protein
LGIEVDASLEEPRAAGWVTISRRERHGPPQAVL